MQKQIKKYIFSMKQILKKSELLLLKIFIFDILHTCNLDNSKKYYCMETNCDRLYLNITAVPLFKSHYEKENNLALIVMKFSHVDMS